MDHRRHNRDKASSRSAGKVLHYGVFLRKGISMTRLIELKGFTTTRRYVLTFVASLLAAVVTFAWTAEKANALDCYPGISCFVKNSNCGFWGGINCGNIGGQQDHKDGCTQDPNGWYASGGQCGTVLKWSLPYWCMTPSLEKCGTNTLPC